MPWHQFWTQEFKIQSHNDSAEFGGVLGGTINTVTKSGTNELHGTAWEYLRNDAFNARDYFLPSVAPFKENTFGATVGGPVYIPKLYNGRNRTFFFFGYQGFRYRSPANSFFRVPTAANLAGDMSDWPRQIYDPFSTRANPDRAGTFIRDPFAGNQIPASRLDRGTVAFAKAVLPAPVQTGLADRNAIDSTPTHNNNEEINIRADHNFSAKDAVMFRYSGSFQTITESGAIPAVGQTTNTLRFNFGGSWTHTFGPSALLQAQLGHTYHRDEVIKAFNFATADLRKQVGYSDILLSPYVDGKTYLPNFNVAQFFAGGESRIFRKPGDTWQPKATFSKMHGNHNLKMGGEMSTMRYMLINETPTVGFNTAQTADPLNLGRTGSPLASFLLGVPDSASRRNILETQPWGIVMGFFLQDQWKVSQKLTLNLGLRYDRTFIPPSGREADGNNEVGSMDLNRGVYVLEKLSPPCSVRGKAPCIPTAGGVLPPHVEVSPDGKILHDTTLNFQPRLGVAYRLSNKTALRAGGGIYFDNYSGIVQTSRNFSGSWPSLGWINLANLNYPTQAQPAPAVRAVDSLPSSVYPEATPFNQNNYFPDPNWKNAYSMQWNAGVQHEINASTVVTANYVGSGGRRTDVGGFYNVALVPGPGNTRDRSPFPYIVPTQYDRSIGLSNYHSFQFQIERRWSGGLAYGISYTWSKSIDTGSSDYFKTGSSTSIQDPYHYRNDRSVSSYDLTHVLNFNWVYQLPLGRGKAMHTGNRAADYILGNWQLNGIARVRSGVPYNLSVAGDVANTGNTGYMRPNLVGNPSVSNPRPEQWFNQAAFAVPAAFTFGTFGRNVLRTDWNRTVDVSLFRQIPIHERVQAQLRGEAFNAFNTPIFGAPVGDITNVNFGRVLNVGAARVMQLSLKIIF